MNNIEKIIFLDMDGVINANKLIRQYFKNYEDQGLTFEEIKKKYINEFCSMTELIFPELAKYIVNICDKTNAYIVWSSSWRNLDKYTNIKDAQAMFERRGLPGNRLIDYTNSLHLDYVPRYKEIRNWIQLNGKTIKRFAILDDLTDAKYNTKRCKFFQTNRDIGITEQITNNVIQWLNY